MKKNITTSFIFLIFGIIIGYFLVNMIVPNFQSFESKREIVIGDMNSLISQQVEEGNYRCCIEPACTMCFLGNWIWDDGICRCDDMIAQELDDKVCPQCKKGLEEGLCKSTDIECEVKQ